MIDLFRGLGPLRLVLIATVVALIILGPISGGAPSFDGIALFTTLIAPVAYAIFVFVLPLDIVMARVFMSGAGPERRAALKRAIVIEGILFVLIILAWMPYVLKLLRLDR